MIHDPKEINEFKCFDDFDNDGWGNSTLEIQERNRRFPEDEENEIEGDDLDTSDSEK